MKRLLLMLTVFVHSSFSMSLEEYKKLYPGLYADNPALKADEVLKKLQSPVVSSEDLKKIFQTANPNDLQKTADTILELAGNKILEQFDKIKFEDVKNFIANQANALKQHFITGVLQADVDAFRRDEQVKRYTIAKPKDLSQNGTSHEAEFLHRGPQVIEGVARALGRLDRTRATLERITGITPKDPAQIPRIGLVFSGGS